MTDRYINEEGLIGVLIARKKQYDHKNWNRFDPVFIKALLEYKNKIKELKDRGELYSLVHYLTGPQWNSSKEYKKLNKEFKLNWSYRDPDDFHVVFLKQGEKFIIDHETTVPDHDTDRLFQVHHYWEECITLLKDLNILTA